MGMPTHFNNPMIDYTIEIDHCTVKICTNITLVPKVIVQPCMGIATEWNKDKID